MTAGSSSSSPAAAGRTGCARTRNAQAQAELRARRKAYIKTLEDTVSSLEACVRQLRAQNAELSSSSGSNISSKRVDSASATAAAMVEDLRAENAKLHTLLAEAGLAAAAATRLAKMGSKSSTSLEADEPVDTVKLSVTEKENEETIEASTEAKRWSNTCSITTKKRKLSKVQAFAKDIDSQLNTLPVSTSTSTSTSTSALQASSSATSSVQQPEVGLGLSSFVPASKVTPAPSSTSLSSRDSVVSSHRSPSTPQVSHSAPTLPPQKAIFSEPAPSLPLTHVARPWSETVPPCSTTPLQQQAFALQPQLHDPAADLTVWLAQMQAIAPPTPWQFSFNHQADRPSASISGARSPTNQSHPPCSLWRRSGGVRSICAFLEPVILV